MIQDQNPKEFWIGIDSSGNVLPIAKDTPLTEDDMFKHGFALNLLYHTIEYSAYEKLRDMKWREVDGWKTDYENERARADRLKEAFQETTQLYIKSNKALIEKQTENQKLRDCLNSIFLYLSFENVSDWRDMKKQIGELIGQTMKETT